MNIIELAKEAGFDIESYGEDDYGLFQIARLERFANLIAAQLMSENASIREAARAEALEEAAKVCAMMEWQGRSDEAIWKGDAADECAAAIRGLK